MLTILSTAAVIGSWDPWQPEPGTLIDPEPRCVAKFGVWLDNKWDEYNFCTPQSGNVFQGWIDSNGTQQILPSLKNDTTRASDCATSCFNSRDWERGSRWLVASWRRITYGLDAGICSCYGSVEEEAYDSVFNNNEYYAVNQTQCEDYFSIWIPLSCLWTSENPCIKAPGPPAGCLWTDNCCVDAKGYVGFFNGFWPPPWWVFVGCGALITCIMVISSLMTLSMRPPRRRGDVHRPPEDPGVSGRVQRLAHRKNYVKRLKSLMKAPTEVHSNSLDESCCICLEELSTDTLVVLRCEHNYHYACMKKYVSHQIKRGVKYPRCPTCRMRIGLTDEEASERNGTDGDSASEDEVSPDDVDAVVLSEESDDDDDDDEDDTDHNDRELSPLNPLNRSYSHPVIDSYSASASPISTSYPVSEAIAELAEEEEEGPTYSPLVSTA